MPDHDDVLAKLERLEEQIDEVRHIVTSIQLSSAEGRGDLKVVVGKLDNAATALANAAQSIQRSELQAATASGREDGRLPKWAQYGGLILLAIIAALVGVKELLPVIIKMIAGF